MHEYLIDLNGTRAYRKTHPRAKRRTAEVNACRLLRKARVRGAIEAALADRKSRLKMTADEVLEELTRLGRSNMFDFLRITPDGDPCIDLSALTRDQAAVLAETTVEDFTEGRGDNARDVRRVKIKLHDKVKALHLLGQYHKLFTEKIEGSTPDGRPFAVLVPVTASPEEWDKLTHAQHGGGQ